MRTIVKAFIAVTLAALLYSCSCKDAVHVLIVAPGHKSDTAMLGYYSRHDSIYKEIFVCWGDEVTISWGGTEQEYTIEPFYASADSGGIKYERIYENTTIKLIPKKPGCSGGQEVKITMVDGSKTLERAAYWDTACSKIEFVVSDYQISDNLKVSSVKADFTRAEAGILSCPPGTLGFLNVFFKPSKASLPSYSNRIDEEHGTIFTPAISPNGRWIFDSEGCRIQCKSPVKFILKLDCPPRQ